MGNNTQVNTPGGHSEEFARLLSTPDSANQQIFAQFGCWSIPTVVLSAGRVRTAANLAAFATCCVCDLVCCGHVLARAKGECLWRVV
jgi:hypothetical protein